MFQISAGDLQVSRFFYFVFNPHLVMTWIIRDLKPLFNHEKGVLTSQCRNVLMNNSLLVLFNYVCQRAFAR